MYTRPLTAAEFVGLVRGSNSVEPDWLGQVTEVASWKALAVGPGRWVACAQLHLEGSRERVALLYLVASQGGYSCEVCDDWEQLMGTWEPPPAPHQECAGCGASFPAGGHVAWGGLSCDRCQAEKNPTKFQETC